VERGHRKCIPKDGERWRKVGSRRRSLSLTLEERRCLLLNLLRRQADAQRLDRVFREDVLNKTDSNALRSQAGSDNRIAFAESIVLSYNSGQSFSLEDGNVAVPGADSELMANSIRNLRWLSHRSRRFVPRRVPKHGSMCPTGAQQPSFCWPVARHSASQRIACKSMRNW
jgi:hypothetical protein